MHSTDVLIRKARRQDLWFSVLGCTLTVLSLAVLGVLLAGLVRDAVGRIGGWEKIASFFTSFPSRHADRAGILSAWVGSILVMVVTALTAIPLGVAAGVYLEEYAKKNRLTAFIEINITNLAGVPSIVYGLMALGLFIYKFEDWFDRDHTDGKVGLGQSVMTAGFTLAFMILPIVIVATREALRAIPQFMREAAYALGATRWQVVKHHLLPYSSGGIMTGVIIALSRAMGETAPLITVGALTYIAFLPPSPFSRTDAGRLQTFAWLESPYTVLPIQMYNWVSRPDPKFLANAAAAGLVLMVVTLTLNTAAIILRYRIRRKIKW